MAFECATRKRFLTLCEMIEAKNCLPLPFKWPNVNPDIIFNDLRSRYSEPHRAYHTLGHIEHCLNELDSARSYCFQPVPDLKTVEMAIWYHDAIYDPASEDNERASRLLFLEHFVLKLENSLPFFDDAGRLILETNHTLSMASSNEAKILLDIDLSILGQPEDAFEKYERQIRQEYKHLSNRHYYVGRLRFVHSFLHRPTIYLTDFFRQKYEEQARQNLTLAFANAVHQLKPFTTA